MKLKAFLVTMLVAGVAASMAVASPPADKGREGETGATPTTKKAGHEPKREQAGERRRGFTLLLKGEFVSASGDSFAMLVQRSNKHGRALRGKQVTVLVDDKTKFRRQGVAELADLAAGDRLLVLVRARKNTDASALELLARFVQARPAKDEAGRDAKREEKREAEKREHTKADRTKTDTVTVAD
jgi:hypothetical protein